MQAEHLDFNGCFGGGTIPSARIKSTQERTIEIIRAYMKKHEIKRKIQVALADFWWCPDAFTVVERSELLISFQDLMTNIQI